MRRGAVTPQASVAAPAAPGRADSLLARRRAAGATSRRGRPRPGAEGGDAARATALRRRAGVASTYSWICAPSSTTRLGGSPKKALAVAELRDMTMKSFLRQVASFAVPVESSVSRPR